LSIKEKFINGVMWSGVAQFGIMGLEFFFGVILARLLSPAEFGILGMITVFIMIAYVFINAGFSQALSRKPVCVDDDFSTVFVFNLVTAVFLFVVLYLCAPLVSAFYEVPQITWLLRVLGLSLIISAFTIVQKSQLERAINFKLLSKISIVSTVLSGSIAIAMAYMGYGVWSLVAKFLSRELFQSIILWMTSKWKTSLHFNRKSFDELFGFGSKLLISGLLGTIMNNVYYVIIGKFFSPVSLGYYTRAELFNKLPSESLSGIVTSVAYPTLAKVQDDPVKLKEGFRKILSITSFVVFVAMAGLMAVAEPFILTLIGEKWLMSAHYLQMLGVIGMIYPLNSINVNMLNVIGRSDLYMNLQFIMQLLIFPAGLLGLKYGIDAMIYAMIVNAFIGYFLFAFHAGKHTGYTILEQIKDFLPGLGTAILMGVVVYGLSYFLKTSNVLLLVTQILVGVAILLVCLTFFKPKAFIEIKAIAQMFLIK